jgi:hypothetical protein
MAASEDGVERAVGNGVICGDEFTLAVPIGPFAVDAASAAAPTTTAPANPTHRMPVGRAEPAVGCASYQLSQRLWASSM